jgi:hypothetical protein
VGTPRGGSRRAARPKRRLRPALLGLALGALLTLAAWGFLVWLAVDSGRSARGGDSAQWGVLAAASLGAVACLFGCLWLVTLLLRKIGILEESSRSAQPHRH